MPGSMVWVSSAHGKWLIPAITYKKEHDYHSNYGHDTPAGEGSIRRTSEFVEHAALTKGHLCLEIVKQRSVTNYDGDHEQCAPSGLRNFQQMWSMSEVQNIAATRRGNEETKFVAV